MSDSGPLLRPLPQRNFQITPASTEPPTPPTPDPGDSTLLDAKPNGVPQSRSHSILNLTSSTLFGIYSPENYEGLREEQLNTPWGAGSMTPVSPPTPSRSLDTKAPVIGAFDQSPPQQKTIYHHHPKPSEIVVPVVLRTILLFGFGMAYGLLVTHLHDDHRLAPVKVEGIDRHSWHYLIFWGTAGVAMGSLLPWVDVFSENLVGSSSGDISKATDNKRNIDNSETRRGSSGRNDLSIATDWNPVVRSVGAFIGIAFAIRKLPWQSTLQVSLTLALVNPVLWYLVDRSKPGFILSTIIGILGTVILAASNSELVPSPATSSPTANIAPPTHVEMKAGWVVRNESIAVWTWVASVLFCSCVCFGNVGRMLALRWETRS